MHGGLALAPRIGIARRLGDLEALEQRGLLLGVEDGGLHGLQADALQEAVRALEVLAVLAVVLQERQGHALGLRGVGDPGQEVALADRRARRAADVDLPAALDGDQADVLDVGLGAVARAARHRRLDLVRGVQALHGALEVDAGGDRVAEAEAAEVRPDARLDRAHRLGVRVAGRHPEVGPHGGQVLLAHAQQVDALAARDLDHRQLVLVGDVGDPPQLVGRDHAAADARHDAERAVVLDVGVDAVVDEARVALLAEPARLALGDEVGQPGLAGAALAPGAARRAQLADRGDVLLAHDARELLARLAPARAQERRVLALAAALERQQLADDGPAGTAARAGAGDRDDLLRRAQA